MKTQSHTPLTDEMLNQKYYNEDLSDFIVRLRVVEGWSRYTIINWLMESQERSKSSAYQKYNIAASRMAEEFRLLKPTMLTDAVAQYEQFLEENRSNPKLWLKGREQLDNILGLRQRNTIELPDNNGGVKEFRITYDTTPKVDEPK
jgi:hypothetical protein